MSYDYQTADPSRYSSLKEYSKLNRNNPTEAETILWQALRANQLGKRIKRQHIIGDFIVDFVCLESHLVIELDGAYHGLPKQQINDSARTDFLERHGYTVIRFSNEDVLKNTNEVLEKIKQKL